MRECDFLIIGGGIVGLATAYQLRQQFPECSVIVLEKERRVAQHQTGHNSGVLHSGIYYRPGSLKATNCRRGKQLMQEFCDEHEIAYELCGKVIVAVDDAEVPRLENIFERGQQNGVQCRMIDRDELRALEPHARGVQAIHVPEAGIIDFAAVCRQLSQIIGSDHGSVVTGANVIGIETESDWVRVRTADDSEPYRGRMLLSCAGLHADRMAKLAGGDQRVRIVPFRGEYYVLRDEARHLCRNLIYPTPDPAFPFLGVHFTRMINGSVECGPNAVLALAREGYRWSDISVGDLVDTLSYPAFWNISRKYWRTGVGEVWRSLSKAAFVRALQRLIPDVRSSHLIRAPAGVRAQALDADGNLLDDFAIHVQPRMIHVLNAPSPAATASLAIAETIVGHVEAQLALV